MHQVYGFPLSNVAQSRDEAGLFLEARRWKCYFPKIVRSEATYVCVCVYIIYLHLLKKIQNAKLFVGDMKTCIFVHKSR